MRCLTPIEHQLLRLAEPAAEALGLRIVRVRIQGAKRVRVQIMAERRLDGLMGIEDCARLSRDLSAVFDVEDPIRGEYVLEVSSPGIDRPLTAFEDFVRWQGFEARIAIHAMVDGRKRFSGVLGVPVGDRIVIHSSDGIDYVFDFADIQEARLVLTERLIAEDLRRAAEAARPDMDQTGADAEGGSKAKPGAPARGARKSGTKAGKSKGRAPKRKAGIGPDAGDPAGTGAGTG